MDSDMDIDMHTEDDAATHGGFRIDYSSLRQGKAGKGKSKSKAGKGKSKSEDYDSDKEDSDDYGGKGKNRRIGVGEGRYCDEDDDDDPGHQVCGKGKGKSGKVGLDSFQDWVSRQQPVLLHVLRTALIFSRCI